MWESLTGSGGLALLATIGGALLGLGKAFQWLLSYIDTRAGLALAGEKAAREDLKSQLEERIADLDKQVAVLLQQNSLYLRRVYQLESFVMVHGMKLPDMPGWPP